MKNSPLVSIVIPTQDRHQYLEILVKRLLLLTADDFEIVIHDNSKESGKLKVVGDNFDDPRLKYIHDPASMSLAQNFEKSLLHASGEYICMIGDDDGVTPELFALANWMKQHRIEAAVLNPATYLWPGVESMLDGKQAVGILRIPDYSTQIDFIDMEEALDNVLSSGAIRIGHLPRVYHGLVSKRSINALTKLAGTPFPGPSPDMANAIGLSAVIGRFVKVSFPVLIAGTCEVSAAAEGARHRHVGEIAERKFLPTDIAQRWPRLVPYYFSGPTLWATTLILALEKIGRSDAIQRMRYDRLYAACCVFAPEYRRRVAEVRLQNPDIAPAPKLILAIAWIWKLRIQALTRNIKNRVRSRFSNKSNAYHIPDIGLAITRLDELVGEISFKEV